MESTPPLMSVLAALAVLLSLPAVAFAELAPETGAPPARRGRREIRVVHWQVTKDRPPLHGALYPEPRGVRMICGNQESADNGRTWSTFEPKPDFAAGLPHGYRRSPVTSVVDPNTGRLVTIVNSLDTPGLDPNANEPRIALNTYYLRCRVSEDGGRSWLHEEPIVQTGEFTPEHPFEGIRIGKNGFFLGDAGSIPLVTRAGKILIPAQATLLGEDGELWNPTGAYTFTDVLVALGTWREDGRLRWQAAPRVKADPARSTRGMIEPTLAEFPDGRILMVMRGSNSGKPQLPSHRWFSVSEDGGETWTEPQPWTYDDGMPFFSPSSMSTLFRHSSGRVFWIGNVSETNCNGNSPRHPVVMGEVDPESLTLRRNSVVVIDKKRPEDETRGRLDLCHFRLLEDRETGEIVLTYPRSHNSYKSREWALVRVAVETGARRRDPVERIELLPPAEGNPRNSEGDFVQLRDGRLMLVYTHFTGGGGDHSKAHLAARFSADGGRTWTKESVTVLPNEGGMNVMSVSLLRLQDGRIALFYARKNSLADCRPFMRVSTDEAKTWSDPLEVVPDEQLGYYVLNNDRVVQLKGGRLVVPLSQHNGPGWKEWTHYGHQLCYLSDDAGKTWRRSKSVLTGERSEGARVVLQEPGIIELRDGHLMMFSRSTAGCQFVSYSEDGGETWSKMARSNMLSPCSPATLERIPSTGDLLLVWNDHSAIDPSLNGKRTPLTVAVSHDDAKTWGPPKTLYDDPAGWYCYTALECVGDHVVLAHCAGHRHLAQTNVTRFPLAWLEDDSPEG